MVHEYGIMCPRCRTSDPAANMLRDGKFQTRSPNCPRCGGDGWLYRDPFVVRGLATSIRQQKNPVDVDIMQPGDMQFSVDPTMGVADCAHGGLRRISEDDRFTQTWTSALDQGQGIVRGASSLDENARLVPTLDRSEDRLWYEPSAALWCEDEHGKTYTQDANFVLGPGKVIKWLNTQPPIGTKYVLKYTAYFEWLVWAPPQERYDRDNKDIGPLVFLRKRHVAFVNESPFVSDTDRVPLAKRVTC
jgi:hypothetical protein